MSRKTGPLTLNDLAQLWTAVTDPSYSRPFLEQGEGQGYEAHSQSFAQHERVSVAIDRTTQAYFLQPHSSQTSEPASGARRAQVTLTLRRSGDMSAPCVVAAGFAAEEEEIDFSAEGSLPIRTGRRYLTTETIVFGPGDGGPYEVDAVAERPGAGYNNPLPGALRVISQPGTRFGNDGATLVAGPAVHKLTVKAHPDVVILEHVGQYIVFVTGANAGQVRRIVAYEGATLEDGGSVALAPSFTMRLLVATGTFTVGEIVTQGVTGAQARVVAQKANHVLFERINAVTLVTGQICFGTQSGSVAVFDLLEESPDMTSEAGTATWRILDWAADLGLSVMNAASPEGGATGVLDELLSERGIQRRTGEGDEAYRARGSVLADVVSPNALIRAANRVLAPLGAHGCLREVGLPKLRGFFYDVSADLANPEVAFAWDLDFVAVSGTATGNFIQGEKVVQDQGGVLAIGHASVSTPLGLGPVGPTTFLGASGVNGTFRSGFPIVGQESGAVVASPVVSGGLQPRDRYKLWLDYTQFRGFFLMGVPNLDLGDFGFAWDLGGTPAYDSTPFYSFFDGQPLTAATIYRAIWLGIEEARAGGVGFELILDEDAC